MRTRQSVRVLENVFPMHLVVQQIEPVLRRLFRLDVQLPLKPPDAIRSRQAHANLRVLGVVGSTQKRGPFPSPALPGFVGTMDLSDAHVGRCPEGSVERCDLSPGMGLPRCAENRSSVLFPVPRWTPSPACVGCFGDRCQPSPFVRRVGVHGTTFEACSGFTRVTARTIANLSARQCTQGFTVSVAVDAAWVATEAHRQSPRVELSSTGSSHLSWRTDKVVLVQARHRSRSPAVDSPRGLSQQNLADSTCDAARGFEQ